MYLFNNFLLFILIWQTIFFINLSLKISIPSDPQEGYPSSAPKKTYIGLKMTLTTAISLFIMLFLIFYNLNYV